MALVRIVVTFDIEVNENDADAGDVLDVVETLLDHGALQDVIEDMASDEGIELEFKNSDAVTGVVAEEV